MTKKPTSKTKSNIRVISPELVLIHDMIDTFTDLGGDPMARIDARLWAKHYTRRAKKMGLMM